MRTGIGYDIHRLVSGRTLTLGGEVIPFDRGLSGHSDADVVVHAICDALLGAAGLGDIGRHFPDNDPQFKDISSLYFLGACRRMLADNDWTICNVDSVIFAEAPRVAPHSDRMRQNIARTLDVDPDIVNIKATTTEGLGAIGKGDGIAAMSIVLID